MALQRSVTDAWRVVPAGLSPAELAALDARVHVGLSVLATAQSMHRMGRVWLYDAVEGSDEGSAGAALEQVNPGSASVSELSLSSEPGWPVRRRLQLRRKDEAERNRCVPHESCDRSCAYLSNRPAVRT
jgi:hypothetical protein